MGILTKEQIRELIKEKNMVTAEDAQNMLKEMFAETIQEMLEAELATPRMAQSPMARRTGVTSIPARKCAPALESWN